MGLRHRSIRLRVGILIVVPVLCLIALYGFAASITLGSALNQTHAKSIKDDLATPVTAFQAAIGLERHDALLSLADPTNTQYASAIGQQEAKTQQALASLKLAMKSPAVTGYASSAERAAITAMENQTNNLRWIRSDVANDAITVRQALDDYNAIINAGYIVIDQAIDQQSSVPLVTQAQDVIDLDQATQSIDAESDLLTADMAQLKFPQTDRIAFAELASLRQSMTGNTLPQLQPQYRALMTKYVTPPITAALSSAEAAVIGTSWHRGAPPAELEAVGPAFDNYGKAISTALAQSATKLQQQAQRDSSTVILQLVLAAGLGLIGTIASIVLSLIIGRGLVRQLRELRESALSLANEKLPGVISQLRAGQTVDVSAYAPERGSTNNEIEQVQQAFSIVQQTAVQTAVDEARLRRGISEVFRNLAGRSQSLLHRQLSLLDGMERRATEPDELEDLFRIDHLTTRMRRHAEGLIILSGEAPARGWRQPVPLIDVLRAAVAEVEDYTRIRVQSRTNAAVAGHAVADVIHLIAELAENATVFSPPNTPVRIQGDIVGRGFAIEIEDRGLGISQARLEEINANLADPPQFDLSGSDRLGLFIAGQLAQRHDIKITLRPSVYGGTTAIVLLPTGLVVEDSFEREPALAAGASLSDDGTVDRFAGRTAALARATSQSGSGNGNVIGLEPEYGRMSLAIGSSRSAADPEPSVVTARVSKEQDTRVSPAELAELGLPVRVRQASMAPQLLRDAGAAAAGSPAGEAGGPAGSSTGSATAPLGESAAASANGPGLSALPRRRVSESAAPGEARNPEEARNTVSALQRGWQLGRAEGQNAGADGGSSSRTDDVLSGRPSSASFDHTDDVLSGRPSSASFDHTDDALSGGSDSGQFNRPDTSTASWTDTGQFNRPDTSSASWSDTGQFNRPDTSSASWTDSGSANWPESGSANWPESGQYGRHDSGPRPFARTDDSSDGRADANESRRPEAGFFGQSDNSPLGRSGRGSVGWPDDGAAHRLVTDRLPADPLAADRLAAERLAAERLAADGLPASTTDERDAD